MGFKYLFFDLDGTLTDPGLGITNSVMYALKKHNMEVADRNELYKFIGPPLIDSFMEYMGMDEEEAKQAVADYREYFSVTGLFENEIILGMPELLASLKEAGYKLVIATSKPEPFTLRILEHFDLAKYFDFVAGALMDETRNRKWEIIKYALDSLEIQNKEEVLMIGDRHHDIDGAKKNGIKSLGVTFGYGSREELEEAGADYIAESVSEIAEILKA